jgi:hypothetical protein
MPSVYTKVLSDCVLQSALGRLVDDKPFDVSHKTRGALPVTSKRKQSLRVTMGKYTATK